MPSIEHQLTWTELSALQEGDVLRSVSTGHTYVVTHNDGGRITAAQTITVRHPEHWVLVRRSRTRGDEA